MGTAILINHITTMSNKKKAAGIPRPLGKKEDTLFIAGSPARSKSQGGTHYMSRENRMKSATHLIEDNKEKLLNLRKMLRQGRITQVEYDTKVSKYTATIADVKERTNYNVMIKLKKQRKKPITKKIKQEWKPAPEIQEMYRDFNRKINDPNS